MSPFSTTGIHCRFQWQYFFYVHLAVFDKQRAGCTSLGPRAVAFYFPAYTRCIFNLQWWSERNVPVDRKDFIGGLTTMARRWHASHLFSVHQRVRKISCHQWAAMAHRWQYKYHITGTSLVKSGTTFEKSGTSFGKSGTSFWKSGTSPEKSGTSFQKGGTSFWKSGTSFRKSGTIFGKVVQVFEYDICTVTYGPWLPIGDMKFFALAGERKRGEMHVTYGPWYLTSKHTQWQQ